MLKRPLKEGNLILLANARPKAIQQREGRYDLTLERKILGEIINSGIIRLFTRKISHESQGFAVFIRKC